ncbi:MAG: glycoside hydrolase family 2 [Chitinophagaceae bacterium]|nr:glycoside hydrolase family 2 [Chitinophagaceae bacterium]
MNRRSFIEQGSILTGGYPFWKLLSFSDRVEAQTDLYSIFKNPSSVYRPFVRWWWTGNKVERDELARELRLLKQAGIGGVEINPIKFPARTNDLGKPALRWLSPEWIDVLKFAFAEARKLELTCDLIVGSGWPFGAEWLEGEERSQAVVIGVKRLEGPLDYEVFLFDLFKEADPSIASPFPGRTMEMLSVQLTPSVINGIEDVKDLSDQIPGGAIHCKVPEGKYVLYALVKIYGFMQVIQGAPGATGPVLNHYNQEAVKKYLAKMSDSIQERIGPLSSQIRSFFTDSLELEGANWCADMPTEFKKRRGYDLMPWLPFILFRTTSMGNTLYEPVPPFNIYESDVYDNPRTVAYGAEQGTEFKQMIQRMRYDFELTKAELIKERFADSFIHWCKGNKVKSRAQAYGRGYFLLEGSFDVDIPEGETWIRPGLGSRMSEADYRVGRAYTVMNKYVSSAAHLKGKKRISCEELTNIHLVFNETLELMKIAGDQSIISGTTYPVFHGFNYSPPEAPFPGWMIYGTFINERNPWWPYFRQFTDYKARLSALLEQAMMFADIAILPATVDLWSIYGAQNDPFPQVMHPEWQTLVWESIHQNGNACDYISESVIQDAAIQDGYLVYGPRKYRSVFLTQVESLDSLTAKKLFDFVLSGGRIFFIECFPDKAPGWKDHDQRDTEVQDWVKKIQNCGDRSVFLNKPGEDHTGWFKAIQKKFKIIPYVQIDSPSKFVSQVRYQAKDVEILLFINSNMNASYEINLTPSSSVVSGKQAWLWDAENGERCRITTDSGIIPLDLGPADLKLLVFDKEKKGSIYNPVKRDNKTAVVIKNPWSITGRHVNGEIVTKEMDKLRDLKEIPEWVNFCGTIIYRNNFIVDGKTKMEWLDLGKAFGVSELFVNGMNAGAKWYGRRVYPVGKFIKSGNNAIEIKIVTTMGNYLKNLTDNRIAQFWTNEGRTTQPLQSTGLLGPVTIY